MRDGEASKTVTDDSSRIIGNLVAANKQNLSLDELRKITLELLKNHEVNPAKNISVLMMRSFIDEKLKQQPSADTAPSSVTGSGSGRGAKGKG